MNVARLRAAIFMLLLLAPAARAEHACDDGMPVGREIKRDERFPEAWFHVGGKSIVGPSLFQALKRKYPERYVQGYEEGPFGDFCVRDAEGYLELYTSDFGQAAWYSRTKPKCARCSELPGFVKRHPSGTGLRLGLTRRQVAAILGVPIEGDAATLTFDEHVVESGVRVLHSHGLSLEFSKGRLVAFMVGDSRESD